MVMADKSGRASGTGVKPVQMRLFATGEVEKSTPNCIPRLCSLTLSRLIILKALEHDLQSVIIAVKMQSSKRILRSNEIIVTPSGTLDTELELSFCLQYPHFLKRDGNKLHIMLQRRKKYKNRTIPGYKTLAAGQVNMAQVLQRSVDRELNMYTDLKDRVNCVAHVMMISLTSQPVDHLENGRQKLPHTEADRSPDGELSDDDLQDDPGFSSNDDMSDMEPITGDDDRSARLSKFIRGPMRPSFPGRQRNIKQKFIALLKRFKASEDAEEVLDSEQDQDLGDQETNPQEIEDLFNQLETLSDSDPDIDTISVLSTPKPKLRPFFKNRGSTELLDLPKDCGRQSDDSSKKYDSDSHLADLTDPELSDSPGGHGTSSGWESQGGLGASSGREDLMWAAPRPPPSPTQGWPQNKHLVIDRTGTSVNTIVATATLREQKSSLGSTGSLSSRRDRSVERGESLYGPEVQPEPRKVLLEQLAAVFHSDEELPENILLINTSEWQGQLLSQLLQDPSHRVICTCSPADVKATLSFLVNKIQKFCNTNSQTPAPIRMAVAGGDRYINSVLRPYVEQFSSKSPDWQTYIKFLVIPLGGSSIGKYMSQLDGKYSSFFNDIVWKDAFEKSENSCRQDMGEVVKRIHHYVTSADNLVQLPIAEAMLTFKDKSSEEDSTQAFVPFLNEVRIGPIDVFGGMTSSVDLDDNPCSSILSSSPPQSSLVERGCRESHTPPNSPNIGGPVSTPSHTSSTVTSPAGPIPPEVVDLQLDYWTTPGRSVELPDRADRLVKKDSKSSLKTTFRSVQVYRLPASVTSADSNTLSMTVVTKENKKKIMRIGKKSKEQEAKSQVVEGITRLVCTSKSQNHPLTVSIDTVEWFGVKFFQLSAQWQTHIKHFPVVTFGHSDAPYI